MRGRRWTLGRVLTQPFPSKGHLFIPMRLALIQTTVFIAVQLFLPSSLAQRSLLEHRVSRVGPSTAKTLVIRGLLGKRQSTCDPGYGSCAGDGCCPIKGDCCQDGDSCCPNDTFCCSDEDGGGCCRVGTYCLIDGCCPTGSICEDDADTSTGTSRTTTRTTTTLANPTNSANTTTTSTFQAPIVTDFPTFTSDAPSTPAPSGRPTASDGFIVSTIRLDDNRIEWVGANWHDGQDGCGGSQSRRTDVRSDRFTAMLGSEIRSIHLNINNLNAMWTLYINGDSTLYFTDVLDLAETCDWKGISVPSGTQSVNVTVVVHGVPTSGRRQEMDSWYYQVNELLVLERDDGTNNGGGSDNSNVSGNNGNTNGASHISNTSWLHASGIALVGSLLALVL